MASRSVSTALAGQVLPAVLTKVIPALGGSLYVVLSTTIPTEEGGNIAAPATGTGYASVAVGRDAAHWKVSTSDPRRWVNAQAVAFPTPTAPWGRIAAYAVFAEDGTFLWGEALAKVRDVQTGATVRFAPGDLGLSA